VLAFLQGLLAGLGLGAPGNAVGTAQRQHVLPATTKLLGNIGQGSPLHTATDTPTANWQRGRWTC